jgi:hypothetical protein
MKTFFRNSTLATGSSTESSTQSLDFLLTSYVRNPPAAMQANFCTTPNSLCAKLSHGLALTGWGARPNCNLVLNCASSPRRLLRQKLQDGKCISFSESTKRPMCNIHRNRWRITRGTEPEEGCCPWSLVATTSHIIALKLTASLRLMGGSLSSLFWILAWLS